MFVVCLVYLLYNNREQKCSLYASRTCGEITTERLAHNDCGIGVAIKSIYGGAL